MNSASSAEPLYRSQSAFAAAISHSLPDALREVVTHLRRNLEELACDLHLAHQRNVTPQDLCIRVDEDHGAEAPEDVDRALDARADIERGLERDKGVQVSDPLPARRAHNLSLLEGDEIHFLPCGHEGPGAIGQLLERRLAPM